MLWRTLTLTTFLVALLVLAPAALAQDSGTPATRDDVALFTSAVSGTAAEAAYAFDVFLDFSLAMDENSLSLVVEGEGALDGLGDQPAFTLDLRGRLLADGDEFPIDLALRLQDGILYYSIAGADSDASLWSGVAVDDLRAMLTAQVATEAEPGTLSSLDELQDAAGQLTAVVGNSGLRPEDFLTLTRLPDETTDGEPVVRFSLDISPASLVSADGFVGLSQGLVTAFP
jgi:hypothetical protein